MNKFILVYLAILVVQSPYLMGQSRIAEDELTKSLSADNLEGVTIRNINGSVNVVGTDASTIQITVQRTLKAPSEAKLSEGKEEVKLGTLIEGNHAYVYMDVPWVEFRYNGDRDTYDWHWDNHQHRSSIHYDYQLDFTVHVPRNLSLNVSTINKGNLHIENIQAPMKVNNINGGITMEKVAGPAHVHTINGKVTAHFTKLPSGDSEFYSLNGKVKIHYPPSLNAQLLVKTKNGDMYTDYQVKSLPVKVEKIHKASSKGTQYKVAETTHLQVGQGGPTLSLETFNGDIYLLKNN